MCIGALRHARIGTLVYGTPEPRNGAIESGAPGAAAIPDRLVVVSGVLAGECRERLQRFFRERRED
jgi:tRNA(adenine34) deaminase